MGGAVKDILARGPNNEPGPGFDEFNSVLSSNQYVIADFSATWCGPCKTVTPTYNRLAEQWSIPKYLAFAKIDLDIQPELAAAYEIRSVPSFIFFKDGKRVKVNGIYTLLGGEGITQATMKMGTLAKEKSMTAGNLK